MAAALRRTTRGGHRGPSPSDSAARRRGARRHPVRSLGAAVAGLVVVAGSLAIYGATGIGVAPAADTVLSCTDTWTGSGGTTDWNTAANWSAGVPDATGVDACIPGGATVVDQDATAAVGELTVAKGSTLAVSTAGAGRPRSAGAGLVGLLGTGQRRDADRRAFGRRHGHTHPRRARHQHRRFRRARHGHRRRRRRVEPHQRRHARGRSGWCAQSREVLHAHECIERAARLRDRRSADVPVGLRQDRERGVVARRERRSGVRERVHSPVGCRVRRGRQLPSAGRSPPFATERQPITPTRRSLGLVGGAPATATAVGVTSTVPASVFGQDVRFTATVTPAASGSDPTGSVSFSAGGVLLGTHTGGDRSRGDDRHPRHREPPGGIAAGHRDVRRGRPLRPQHLTGRRAGRAAGRRRRHDRGRTRRRRPGPAGHLHGDGVGRGARRRQLRPARCR